MQLKQGTKLQHGRYEILQTLGQGGFGITYLAEQVLLGRKVTIKKFFMKDCCERDGDSFVVSVPTQNNRALVDRFKRKFLREAKMIASMNHPGIVKILDVFEENETAYYVMDYLSGGSLADIVKKNGPMEESSALKYVLMVADALDYIHSMKIAHLDVKPSNILLDDSGSAVLIDFGISKHYDAVGEQTSSTPVGISKGYAPIEQYNQTGVQSFAPATDIYSLGATLFYLLTAQNPPEATVLLETGGPDVPESISDGTRKAIASAMSPIRKNRPQTIREFCGLLDVEPSQSQPEEEEPEITHIEVIPTLPVEEDKTSLGVNPETDSQPCPPSIELSKGQKAYLWAYYPMALACYSKDRSFIGRLLLAIFNPVVFLVLLGIWQTFQSGFIAPTFSVVFYIYLIVGMILLSKNTDPIIQFARMKEDKGFKFFNILSWISLGFVFSISTFVLYLAVPVSRLFTRRQGRAISSISCKKLISVAQYISIGIYILLFTILLIIFLMILLGFDS